MRSISSAGQPWNVESVMLRLSCGRIIEVAQRREPARNFVAQPLDAFARVDHAADEVDDLRRLDAGQVVADRHVVDRLAARCRPSTTSPNGRPKTSRRVAQHVDQHRPLHVLVERLGDAQLLRPLDVVADVRGVDARPARSSARR